MCKRRALYLLALLLIFFPLKTFGADYGPPPGVCSRFLLSIRQYFADRRSAREANGMELLIRKLLSGDEQARMGEARPEGSQVAQFLNNKGFDVRPVFRDGTRYALKLSRDRIHELQPLLTRWIPRSAPVVYNPFLSARGPREAAEIMEDGSILAPIWFPLRPADYATVMRFLSPVLQIRLARELSYSYRVGGRLGTEMQPFLGLSAGFTPQQTVARAVRGAFALDCIALTNDIHTFFGGIDDLYLAYRELVGFRTILYPKIDLHFDELQRDGLSDRQLRFSSIDASLVLSEPFDGDLAALKRKISTDAEKLDVIWRAIKPLHGSEDQMRSGGDIWTGLSEVIWGAVASLGLKTDDLRPVAEDCERLASP